MPSYKLSDDRTAAKQFTLACRNILGNQGHPEAFEKAFINHHDARRLQSMAKAAVNAQDTTQAWGTVDGRTLADSFMTSLQDASILDAVAQHAMPIPEDQPVMYLGSGATAGSVDEGNPVAVTRLDINEANATRRKAAAIVVTTNELARNTDGVSAQLITRALRDAVIEASNNAFIGALTITNATAGTTALDSLQAGLAAADDALHYVVAAPHAAVRELAMASDGRMGVAGGEFVAGVQVIPAEVTNMLVIPADQMGLRNGVTDVRHVSHASLIMDDDPANADVMPESLFQTNKTAILVQRMFAVFGGKAVQVA